MGHRNRSRSASPPVKAHKSKKRATSDSSQEEKKNKKDKKDKKDKKVTTSPNKMETRGKY